MNIAILSENSFNKLIFFDESGIIANMWAGYLIWIAILKVSI